jgi:hypothetical protein
MYDETPDGPPSPDDLCSQAFSRCSNWPDRKGQLGLAQGLKVASDRFHIPQEAIVLKCRQSSAFCPTDLDLLKVAQELSESAARAQRGVEHWQRAVQCPKCGNSGWEPSWWLWTRSHGRVIRKERITEAVSEAFYKAPPEARTDQEVYSAVARCSAGCAIPVPAGRFLTPEVLR